MGSNKPCDPFADDRARAYEVPLPAERPVTNRNSGPTTQDLDRAFGIGQPSPAAADQRRVRGHGSK